MCIFGSAEKIEIKLEYCFTKDPKVKSGEPLIVESFTVGYKVLSHKGIKMNV